MRSLASSVLVALMVTGSALPALATTEAIYFYPDVDGYPSASLKTGAPTYSGPMLDIDANGKQGRRVDKSDKGLAETDTKKYHQWSIGVSGLDVEGSASLTIWYADKDFKGGDTNRIVAYLLDCGSSGCTELASAYKDVSPPDGENVFKKTTLTFSSFDHTLASGRTLRLRIMIDKDFSNDDMTFAYDTTNYVTSLKLHEVVPPPTTTTSSTTSTTTTTTSTTTTTIPTTTTTEAATTSTSSSTTTAPGPTSTVAVEATTSSSSTTSTTAGERDSTTELAASPTPTTTLPPPPPPHLQDLDTEKTDLVIRTTPAQRGVLVSSESVELTPVEGLMVSFVTAAETVKGNLLSAVGLGLLMASLLVVGMSRRRTESPPPSSKAT